MPVGPWQDHPVYPVADWKYEVANDDTRLGYAEWVDHRIEIDAGVRVTTVLGEGEVRYIQHTIDTCPYSSCPNDDECNHREYL